MSQSSQSHRTLKSVSIVTAVFISSLAVATPLKTGSSLPLTGDDLVQARASLAQDQVEDFAYFIKSLDVLPDHANPKEIAQIENRANMKTFYVTPFFQASEERGPVGGQEIADEGIKIIAEIYDLVGTFDFELFKIQQLLTEKKNKSNALDKLRNNLPKLTEQLAINSTKELIAQIEKEIAGLQGQIAALESKADTGIGETSLGLKQQVMSQIQLKLSFLGVTPNPNETAQLTSNTAQGLRNAMSTMIARATGEGQFGYRNAVMEAGYTKKQRDWIALYRRIRPDVQVTSLATNSVYVRSTALTSKQSIAEPFAYFLGGAQMVNSSRLFLAVNGGSNGKCGNTRSCNVTIEYTWLGATMAKTSRSGAVTMPVYFEADVSFVQPDFEGTVSCDFKNGFSVKGRADVKDGAVIYDGDVYNRINYTALEEGACNYSIVRGDANSAAYHTIKRIYDTYMNLKMERAAKSRAEMERYRTYVNNELAYHASQSQRTNYDFWSLSTWTRAFGGVWGTVASFVVGGARSFYWHTRIEDSTTLETVKFSTTIKETNVEKVERVSFDGFSMLCWKVDGLDRYLSACPSAKLPDYQEKTDTDLGKNQQACGDSGISGECLEQSEQNNNPPTDENGVIEDPWA